MPTRREFLRGAIGWGGLLVAGGWKLAASHDAPACHLALGFLAAAQSADGAWRSERHVAFRDGDALTPVVLWTMQAARSHEESFARGIRWLEKLTDAGAASSALRYPLFTASYAAQVFAQCGDLHRAGAWADVIEGLRTSPALGWPAGHPMCGGWSDAPSPPQYVDPVPDMLAPNISATTLAVTALVAARRNDRAQTARTFIERCQNFAAGGRATAFDDGGFFFALDDPIRNKAGAAGIDAAGRTRFRSYGSATCDGFLALTALGVPLGDSRMLAAASWLQRHGDGLAHAGAWAPDRRAARESLVFYAAQAGAEALAQLRGRTAWAEQRREALGEDLLARQREDGSWQGTSPDSCEDEPLLATSFALRALVRLA